MERGRRAGECRGGGIGTLDMRPGDSCSPRNGASSVPEQNRQLAAATRRAGRAARFTRPLANARVLPVVWRALSAGLRRAAVWPRRYRGYAC